MGNVPNSRFRYLRERAAAGRIFPEYSEVIPLACQRAAHPSPSLRVAPSLASGVAQADDANPLAMYLKTPWRWQGPGCSCCAPITVFIQHDDAQSLSLIVRMPEQTPNITLKSGNTVTLLINRIHSVATLAVSR